jgi:hypothetical protein
LLSALAIGGAASGLTARDAAALARLALRDERLRESWPPWERRRRR